MKTLLLIIMALLGSKDIKVTDWSVTGTTKAELTIEGGWRVTIEPVMTATNVILAPSNVWAIKPYIQTPNTVVPTTTDKGLWLGGGK